MIVMLPSGYHPQKQVSAYTQKKNPANQAIITYPNSVMANALLAEPQIGNVYNYNSTATSSVGIVGPFTNTSPPISFRCVRAGASGSGTGLNWTDAYTTLPATLTRGYIYYVADGDYSPFYLDDPVSGTQVITLKKATQEDHGTDAGWLSSYGDGSARFLNGNSIVVTSYWVIDGVFGSGDTSSYGFRFMMDPATTPGPNQMLSAGMSTHITDLMIRHVDISVSDLYLQPNYVNGMYTNAAGVDNFTFQYCRISNITRPFILTYGNNNLIEHCYIDTNGSVAGGHTEAMGFWGMNNLVIRYNIFKNIMGTGTLVSGLLTNEPNTNIYVYGNVFYRDPTYTNPTNFVLGDNNSELTASFYNNTIHGYNSGFGAGILTVNFAATRINVFNNLWYDNTTDPTYGVSYGWQESKITHGYNTWLNSPMDTSYPITFEAHEVNTPVGASDPFIDSDNGNFHLAGATMAGTTLSSPYNIDIDGNIRGADSTWDRGAYEYVNPQIIADHTIVDRYDDIPAAYMTEIKKMWINLSGESHARGYYNGATLLYAQNGNYPAVINESDGSPPTAYREDALRVNGIRRTGGYWTAYCGEDNWYTNAAGIQSIKDHILYCETHSLHIAAIGFGWCWDMTWHNAVGGTQDPIYLCRWAGASEGGPEGDLRWGLDSADQALTGNSVCMDTYLAATQQYIDYCVAQGYSTKVFFTTGPVDGYVDEAGYQRSLKHQHMRNYVLANPTRILFDYADILCWNDAGVQQTYTWSGHTYQIIHPTNGDGSSTDHIHDAGALRLAKAFWWMMARIAGWDGVST